MITTILSLGNDDPARSQRVFWGAVIGAVAAVLLLAGGLQALQTASIAAALPLSAVVILMTLGMLTSLIRDPSAVMPPQAPPPARPATAPHEIPRG